MQRKIIKTKEGLKEVTLEETISMFELMINKYSHRCVVEIEKYQDNFYSYEDYYQQGVVELIRLFEKYDAEKGACFSTLLHRRLNHKLIMNIRELEAEKRKSDRKYLYINDDENNIDNTNLIKDVKDKYFEASVGLEEFLSERLTETERMLLTLHFKKDYFKARGLYKQSLSFALDIFAKDERIFNMNRSQMAEELNISRPTLNRRVEDTVNKVIMLTREYFEEAAIY